MAFSANRAFDPAGVPSAGGGQGEQAASDDREQGADRHGEGLQCSATSPATNAATVGRENSAAKRPISRSIAAEETSPVAAEGEARRPLRRFRLQQRCITRAVAAPGSVRRRSSVLRRRAYAGAPVSASAVGDADEAEADDRTRVASPPFSISSTAINCPSRRADESSPPKAHRDSSGNGYEAVLPATGIRA